MRWQQFQDNVDEHDAPTEPLMPVILTPAAATIADEMIPTPMPHERPFPVQQAAPPFFPYASARPSPAVYPVLPPAPVNIRGSGRPPGGSKRTVQAIPAQVKHSSLPLFVGIFFVGVQLLLLVRFMLKLIALDGSTAWVGIVYAISGVFVLPFRLLLQNIGLPIPVAFEIYTLLAILMYGLLSRILVRFLKALLNSR